MIADFLRWWHLRWCIFRTLRNRALFGLDRHWEKQYNAYLDDAAQLGIHALSYPDWCGVTSIPAQIDYNELAHNVVLGMYPVCACGDWMHQHKNFTGKCSVCRPQFETENCQEFRFSGYRRPSEGTEKHVALAFNQAIYNCD